MKKYIITIRGEKDYTAASKARADAQAIAEAGGYVPFPFEGERSAKGSALAAAEVIRSAVRNWRRLGRTVGAGSVVLIQYPHYPLKTAWLMKRVIPGLRKKKGIRFIFLVHDLNSLRGTFGQAAVYSDGQLLQEADRIICHNEKMKAYLKDRGIPEEKLIPLGIFDYLTEADMRVHRRGDGIAAAGNLDPEKSGYIGALAREGAGGLKIHLYGNGFPEGAARRSEVTLHGAWPAAELPGVMEGGFGLVWDGPSTAGCEGKMGNYLRYNNPHKLSLYLAAGMPVIIWKEAAEAAFVLEQGLGLTAGSLGEIPAAVNGMTDAAYAEMAARAAAVGAALRSGAFLSAALGAAEKCSGFRI